MIAIGNGIEVEDDSEKFRDNEQNNGLKDYKNIDSTIILNSYDDNQLYPKEGPAVEQNKNNNTIESTDSAKTGGLFPKAAEDAKAEIKDNNSILSIDLDNLKDKDKEYERVEKVNGLPTPPPEDKDLDESTKNNNDQGVNKIGIHNDLDESTKKNNDLPLQGAQHGEESGFINKKKTILAPVINF